MSFIKDLFNYITNKDSTIPPPKESNLRTLKTEPDKNYSPDVYLNRQRGKSNAENNHNQLPLNRVNSHPTGTNSNTTVNNSKPVFNQSKIMQEQDDWQIRVARAVEEGKLGIKLFEEKKYVEAKAVLIKAIDLLIAVSKGMSNLKDWK